MLQISIATKRRERTVLPQGAGRAGLVCWQLAGTVGWWLTWLIFRQIGMHR
jgi:hypothetical protein